MPIRLYILGSVWPAETFVMRKLLGLADAGVLVTIFTRDVGDGDSRHRNIGLLQMPVVQPKYPARSIINMTGETLGKPGAIRATWPDFAEIADARVRMAQVLKFLTLRAQPPGIIHFEWNGPAIHYMPMVRQLGWPSVVSCRGSHVNVAPHDISHMKANPTYTADLAASFRLSAAVHCVSEDIAQEAQQYDLDPAKIRVIRPAVDPDMFTPAQVRKPNDRFEIMIVGSLMWRKGHEYALTALRKLVDAGIDAHLTIIGSGRTRDRVLYAIHDLGLQNHATLIGRVPPAEVVARLQQADLCLLTSHSEGISNAALEGMSCGLPIVTTDCGGMREVVRDGVEGFLVPLYDTDALADRMRRIAEDDTMRQRMGEAARQRILEQHTLKGQIDAFLDLYRSLMPAEEATA